MTITYMLENIVEPHELSITFKESNVTVTTSAGSGGSISPSGANSYAIGSSPTFTITPSAGQVLDTILVNGTVTAPTTTSPITIVIPNIQANTTINISFKADTPLPLTVNLVKILHDGANYGGYDGSTGLQCRVYAQPSNTRVNFYNGGNIDNKAYSYTTGTIPVGTTSLTFYTYFIRSIISSFSGPNLARAFILYDVNTTNLPKTATSNSLTSDTNTYFKTSGGTVPPTIAGSGGFVASTSLSAGLNTGITITEWPVAPGVSFNISTIKPSSDVWIVIAIST